VREIAAYVAFAKENIKKKKKTRTKIAQRACATDGGCVAVVDASHL
jgi:hypothetical protein